MAEVVIYTTSMCPYCYRAKALLTKKGVTFTEIDVGMDPDKRQEMIQRANGRRTVPQIFINDHHIGGYDDLVAADRSGKLKEILGDEA